MVVSVWGMFMAHGVGVSAGMVKGGIGQAVGGDAWRRFRRVADYLLTIRYLKLRATPQALQKIR
jgi:hypothetical protein